MTTLTPQQHSFITRYLASAKTAIITELSDVDATVVGELSAMTSAILEVHPLAKAMLEGLLGAAKDALAREDVAEYQRHIVLLAERLQTLEEIETLPDLKSILDTGLIEKSQALTPQEQTAIELAYETAKDALSDLPDEIRMRAERYAADLARLESRGEQLIAAIQTKPLDVVARAAHHNEIDQICVKVETLSRELESLLEETETAE